MKGEIKLDSINTESMHFNKIVANPLRVEVQIENKAISMKIDTEAYITVISEEDKDKFFPKLIIEKSNLNLTSSFWLKIFDKWPVNFNTSKAMNVNIFRMEDDVKRRVCEKFPQVFSGDQGCYNGRKVHLVFKKDAQPIRMKPYHAPFALAPKITSEIDRLLKAGNLEPIAVSKWATPVIPVLKKNGEVRLCGNFKLTVNPQLVVKRHPIPIKEKIFKTLQVGKEWSQLDLSHAFTQI